MTKNLDMKFKTSGGKEVTLSLLDPKDDLTLAQATTAMTDIIAKDIFIIDGSKLTEIVSAKIRIADTQALV